jgi:hypothetical protein
VEEPGRRIVGDSVENGFWVAGPRLLQWREIEGSFNDACSRINDKDLVTQPTVGKDLSFDKFQFIDSVDRPELIVDFHRAHQGEILGLEEAKESRAVAQNEMFAIPSETPAFSLIMEVTEVLHCLAVEDKSDAPLPCQLVEAISAQGEPLAKELFWERELLEDLSGFGIDFAEGRGPVASGGLIIKAFMEEQSLG